MPAEQSPLQKPKLIKGSRDIFEESLERWEDEGGATLRSFFYDWSADRENLTASDCETLYALGVAVVLGWKELPTNVQRMLFKLASKEHFKIPMNELPHQIARFLRTHKDKSSLL